MWHELGLPLTLMQLPLNGSTSGPLVRIGLPFEAVSLQVETATATATAANLSVPTLSWWGELLDSEVESGADIALSQFLLRVFGAFFCILLVTSTIFGNTLVIIVVARFYRMRTVTNILLAR